MAKRGLGAMLDIIDDALDRRRASATALCLQFAGKALKEFRVRQANQEFWDNQTFAAMDSVFSDAIRGQGNDVGWFLAHGVEYGIYLEQWTWSDELKRLDDGRISSALRVVLSALQPEFFEKLQRIYAD